MIDPSTRATMCEQLPRVPARRGRGRVADTPRPPADGPEQVVPERVVRRHRYVERRVSSRVGRYRTTEDHVLDSNPVLRTATLPTSCDPLTTAQPADEMARSGRELDQVADRVALVGTR